MSEYKLHLADAVKWANEYQGELFHALLCDPPYHLTSIVERFGNDNSAPAKEGVYSRSSKGFMGKQWDGGDVAFQVDTWKSFKRIMYPGAFGMAFASSKGWHRLAVAIEDAGFIIHPSIFGWVYGSGFPKATRIDTQVDDENLAKVWQGHRYGLQALKPALEPIIVFQKPYEGRPISNIVETGAGALNIEGGRIGTESISSNRWKDNAHPFGNGAGNKYETVENDGRWPSNFYLDMTTAKLLDKQSGYKTGAHGGNGNFKQHAWMLQDTPQDIQRDDEGGASRFFFQVSNQIDEADAVYYCAKASREERDEGLDKFPMKRVDNSIDRVSQREGKENANRRGSLSGEFHNPHPTVKPIDLTEYLSTLLLPPEAYSPRRIFVPFAGVGSEMIGAILAGWDSVEGVELTDEYIPIAKARIDYWKSKPKQMTLFDEPKLSNAQVENKPPEQTSLFDWNKL